jgi:integrase
MEGMGAAALRWTILTAARPGETRGATWEEIGSDDLWSIPADRMKADNAYNVYIPAAARACLPNGSVGLIFPALRGGMLSDMTLAAVLKRVDLGRTPCRASGLLFVIGRRMKRTFHAKWRRSVWRMRWRTKWKWPISAVRSLRIAPRCSLIGLRS